MPPVMDDSDFWLSLDQLVAEKPLIVDRPRGASHPRYPSLTYPLDYGYLQGTRAADGDGIDVWIGTLPERRVTGVLCTVDLEKGDAELKLLCGCTAQETADVLATHNVGMQSAILVRRPGFDSPG
jgi:inorganic pyrophosphatase